MIRILILVSIGTVISASPYFVNYPFGLDSLFGVKREASVGNKEKERSVCETEECKLIAKVIKESMDESLDPCDDFYDYACGKWTKNNPLSENMTSSNLWDMVEKKIESQVKAIIREPIQPDDMFAVKLAKKWYISCMDEEAQKIQSLLPLVSTLWRHGGWPLIMEDGEWDDRIYNWQTVDDHYARLYGVNAFHDLIYGQVSYEDNGTIILDTPHLSYQMYKIMSDEEPEEDGYDASDENNESGEGSQEKGSKERKNSNEDEEEDEGIEEDKEDEEEENDAEELRNRRVSRRKNHKSLGHKKRTSSKHSVSRRHKHEKKTRRRTKRDLIQDIVFSKVRSLKRNAKHVAHGKSKRTSGRSSRHGHLTVGRRHRTSAGKNDVKPKGNDKDASVKPEDSKKHVGHSSGKRNKEEDKKGKRINKHQQNGKRRNKRDRGLQKHVDGSKTINGHHGHKQRRISHHRVHHVARKMEDEDAEDSSDNEVNTEDDSSAENGEDEGGENETGETDGEDEGSDDGDENGDEDDEDNDEDDEDSDEDDEPSKEEQIETYKSYILSVATVLSKIRGIDIPREKIKKGVDDLVQFSIKLAKISRTPFEMENGTLNEFQEHFDALDSTTPNSKVNWRKKVLKLFSEAGVEIEGDVDVVLTCPDYFDKLHALLDETPAEVLVNYVHWIFIDLISPMISQDVRDLSGNRFGADLEEREDLCMEVELSEVIAYQYAKKHFSEKLEKTARDMIDDIQKEVEYQIKESTWMDEDTKHFILDKLVHMENMIGYPEWFRNTTAVKRYFQGLTIGPSFYENVQNYMRHRKLKELRKLEDSDLPEVSVDPLMLNAFFMPTDNSIAISAADLQNPFFALNRPWNVNFGIIGVVMAHEVNHGFDDEGHLYDMSGTPMEWLSAMASAYDKRAECFVHQFNKYSLVKGDNFTVKDYGNRTAGENIADTMGLQAVFRAYQRRLRECDKPDPALPGLEKYDNNQTFFLAFANLWCEAENPEAVKRGAKYDVHSTGRLRVIGSVSNSDDFAKSFNCPVGSAMNPKNKCNIWT
nr:membrane metallo-endopeptidase-like 1 [Nomia melanderi]